MGIINFVWEYVVPFLFILTVLVFVHEMGHFWVARRNRVRVEVFSIGFGPEIYGWTDRRGTRWKISAVPLGGYVKMFGETDTGEDGGTPLTPEEREVSFQHKRLGQRTAIVFAGPLANYLFAIVVLAGLYSFSGIPRPLAGVGSVVAGSAADEAGLRPGDRILGIDGTAITWFEDLRRIVMTKPGVRLDLDVLRDGTRLVLKATPKAVRAEDESGEETEIGRLGVTPDPNHVEYERQNPLKALWMGVERSVLLTGQILSYVGQIIAGSQSADQVGGALAYRPDVGGDLPGRARRVHFLHGISLHQPRADQPVPHPHAGRRPSRLLHRRGDSRASLLVRGHKNTVSGSA